ncbi:hypothetical protein ACROYT_G015318 [Oculina patagonica]
MESGKDKYTVAKWLYFFCLDNLQNVNTIPATKACGQNAHKVAFAVQDTPQFECNKFHVVKHIDPGSFSECVSMTGTILVLKTMSGMLVKKLVLVEFGDSRKVITHTALKEENTSLSIVKEPFKIDGEMNLHIYS